MLANALPSSSTTPSSTPPSSKTPCSKTPCSKTPGSKTPWAWFETRDDDGVVVRVAQSREDAEAARRLIRDAWGVNSDERYFYGLFEHASKLYAEVLEPSARASSLRELDAICVLIDAIDEHGQTLSVGTFSLVMNHDDKTIEIGRGAIAKAWQRRRIPLKVLGPMRRLLDTLPDYAVVVDATTLARGAKMTADAVGAAAVALHPSNFTVQPGAVEGWHAHLTGRRGASLAQALLRQSPRSGLGRFMTSFHCRPPAALRPAAPVLTDAQAPFFAYTCAVSKLDPQLDGAARQDACPRQAKVHDMPHTATRMIVDPARGLDVEAVVAEALAEGYETLVVQVPCDVIHREQSSALERAGAILCGVFVDAHGDWRASYTLLTCTDHDTRVREDLAVLVAEQALDPQTMPLLRLVAAHAKRSLERAA